MLFIQTSMSARLWKSIRVERLRLSRNRWQAVEIIDRTAANRPRREAKRMAIPQGRLERLVVDLVLDYRRCR